MSSPHSFEQIKILERNSDDRHDAVRRYLRARKRGFVDRVRRKAKVHKTMVYKVLHGSAVSAPVEEALLAEERASQDRAA